MSEKSCPKCGKKLPIDANFCLNCGAYVGKEELKNVRVHGRSNVLTAGGVLGIVASCVVFFVALMDLIIYFTQTSQSIGFTAGNSTIVETLFIMGFAGFTFGMASSIQALRRKQFGWATVGIAILFIAGALNFVYLTFPSNDNTSVAFAMFLGVPSSILSGLSLVFVAMRKNEFA
jgi:hypothetical protein